MTATKRHVENQAVNSTNLAAGMFINTAQFWGGLFWATANMNWRVAEHGIRVTNQLLDNSYRLTVQSLAGTTYTIAHTGIELWQNSLGMVNNSMRQRLRTFEEEEEAPRQRKPQIFETDTRSQGQGQGRAQVFPQETAGKGRAQVFQQRTVGERTQVLPQESAGQGRTQIFQQEERTPDADASFYFRGPEGQHNLPVDNLQQFVECAQQVDDVTWEYHLKRGDYSHWFRTSVEDEELAAAAMRIEKLNISARDSRERLLSAIRRRYAI